MSAGERREDLGFTSGGDLVAAWHYPGAGAGTGGGGDVCVVMAHGFSLTRHDGLAPYAEAFAGAGYQALVFDHRYLGDSGGEPRQRFRIREQLEDWANAIAFARTLEGVSRIVLWGFSFSGGHVATLCERRDDIDAALVLCPFADGLARTLATKPGTAARIIPRAVRDVLGQTNLIPVTAQPGELGAMTFPGEAEGFEATVRDGSPWRNEITPGLFLTVGLHRPVARARRISCPLWVGIGDRDISVSAKAVERLASRAPQGELHRYPYDHFEPFVGDAPAQIAADQLTFLRGQTP